MGWLNRTTPAAPAGFTGAVGMSNALYPEAGFLSNAKNGFGKNELVFACIMEKATSAPEAPLRVYGPDGLGEPQENHPLRKLIANPNPVVTEFELFELTLIHMDLAGMGAWEIVRDRAGRPSEVWPLRPDLLRFLVGRDGRVDYGYVTDGQVVPLGRDVVLFKYPNPTDLYVGQAPLRPTMRAMTLDNEATDYVTSLLQNRAIPGAVVTTQEELDEAQTKRLRTKWKQAFGGRNVGDGPAFLQQGMEVKELGLTPKQMELPDLRAISESRICMTLGVPPVLVGAKVGLDRSTFANYGEARKSLWEETLMPLQRRLRDVIVRDLLPMTQLGPQPRRVKVKFDRSEVLALKESEQAIWERATQALRAGAITVNDFRRTVGMPTVQGGDVFLRPAGVIPTDASGHPTEDAEVTDMNDQQLTAFVAAGIASIREGASQ